MLDQNNTDTMIFLVSIPKLLISHKTAHCLPIPGALVYDPAIGDFTYTNEQVPMVPYAQPNQALLNLNSTFLAQLESLDK